MDNGDDAPCGSKRSADSSERRLTLHVRIDQRGRPTGTLRGETGEDLTFDGWLALIAELTQALAQDP